jgi:hypothetical protein
LCILPIDICAVLWYNGMGCFASGGGVELVWTNSAGHGRNLLLYHISPGLSRVLGKIKNKKFFEKVLTNLLKCGIIINSGRLPA